MCIRDSGTAGFASNGFVYAVELPSGKLHKKFSITPLSVGTTLAPTSTAGGHRFRSPGIEVAIESRGGGRGFATRVDARTESGGRIEARLDFGSQARDEHLAI